MAKKRPKVGASTNLDMKKGIEEALEIGKKVAEKNTPQPTATIAAEKKVNTDKPKAKVKKAPVAAPVKEKESKPIDRNKYRKEVHKIIYLSKQHHEKAKVAAFHQRITMRQYVESLIDKDA